MHFVTCWGWGAQLYDTRISDFIDLLAVDLSLRISPLISSRHIISFQKSFNIVSVIDKIKYKDDFRFTWPQ